MSITSIIEVHYANLTQSERKVANYILNNPIRIVSQTMQDIKDEIGVGDATIIRFSQKIGFSGFSDLKIEIAKEDYNLQMATENDSSYLTEALHFSIKTLEHTNKLLIEEKLLQSAQAIHQAEHINIIGVGASGHSAQDLQRVLLRVGVNSHTYRDTHIQAQTAAIASEKDLIIAFSLTGRTLDVYDSLVIAKENNVPIIAITNRIDSPIALLADIVLRTVVEEFLDGGSIQGRISQMHIIDALLRTYEREYQELSLGKREKALRTILDKRIPEESDEE